MIIGFDYFHLHFFLTLIDFSMENYNQDMRNGGVLYCEHEQSCIYISWLSCHRLGKWHVAYSASSCNINPSWFIINGNQYLSNFSQHSRVLTEPMTLKSIIWDITIFGLGKYGLISRSYWSTNNIVYTWKVVMCVLKHEKTNCGTRQYESTWVNMGSTELGHSKGHMRPNVSMSFCL